MDAHSKPLQNDIKSVASRLLFRKTSEHQLGLLFPFNFINETKNVDVSKVKNFISPDDVISSVSILELKGKQNLLFHLDQKNFIRNVLGNRAASGPSVHQSKRVIVEFR